MSFQPDEDAIVFVHGFLGFSEIPLLWWPIRYFRHARACLAERGLTASFPSLPPAGSIEVRAAALSAFLGTLSAPRIHLIAHSMGGLDSRFVAQALDPQQRIRSVITIGTPHRGTPVASWFFETGGVVPWLGRTWLRKSLQDLTPEACDVFNRQVKDRTDVRYVSFAGVRPVAEMPALLRPWTRLLQQRVGDNDGLVPAPSTIWGEVGGTLRSDHLELVGWSLARRDVSAQRPFDDRSLYRRILDVLQTG
jgi:triacylglycerol lipase